VSKSVLGLSLLVVFEQAARWFPYKYMFPNFLICQNLQHTHVHKGHVSHQSYFRYMT
jgi:hypothetical protein